MEMTSASVHICNNIHEWSTPPLPNTHSCTHKHTHTTHTHAHTHTHTHTCTHTHIHTVTSQSLPSFTVHPLSGVYYNLAANVSLRCEALPITGMQWLHNGRLIFTDSRRTVGLNTLTISPLTSDVAGSYACLARNDLGTVISAVANIQIAGKHATDT